MSTMAKMVMGKFYRKAEGKPERLPWHQENPDELLKEVVEARKGRGRALDVGCGAGVFTVWLAQQGLEVTGLDLFPEAIAMARARATERGTSVELVCSDLFSYAPERPFDLVLDSGCLHSLVGGDTAAYKRQLLTWLAKGGDYFLGHWGKRHAFDYRPIGPRRRSQAQIESLLAPELELVRSRVEDFPVPLPFGPVVRGVGYWFRRRS